jgi:hypothetical protein
MPVPLQVMVYCGRSCSFCGDCLKAALYFWELHKTTRGCAYLDVVIGIIQFPKLCERAINWLIPFHVPHPAATLGAAVIRQCNCHAQTGWLEVALKRGYM